MSKYEYGDPNDFKKLESEQGQYFSIPCDIILSSDEDVRRVTAFSFFSIWRASINMKVRYSVNEIMEWTNRKVNRNKNSTNAKLISAIEYLADEGYIFLDEPPKTSSRTIATFNFDKVKYECDHYRYAVVWVDEINKIFQYDSTKSMDRSFNNDILLLVFAYLRMIIPRRKNLMEKGDQDIDEVRKRWAETWATHYNEIAEALGISERAVSKSIDILKELKLIYSEPMPRYQNEYGEWRTDQTLFCNYYKREHNILFDYGRSYYSREIKNKKNELLESKKKIKKHK